jgi:hypothetical protein
MSGLNVSEKGERTRQTRARARSGTRVESRAPAVAEGDRFGELTVESFHEYRDRNMVWLCRCECGRMALRVAGGLVRAKRLGHVSACDGCLDELRHGAAIARRSMRHEALWRLWSSSGTLWSEEAIERIEDDIRTEVGRELGGWTEERRRCTWI